ncbi:substrate-binding domain-containing protein [Dysgonomonas termitidis]|uniref:histidine kinase n=1 Tax=Dysgonomonas termitidis TaxID=1516126 RepID=A0ABV9L3C7_9BACT
MINKIQVRTLLLLILLSCIFSCSDEGKEKQKYVIGFSQCTSDPWREAVILEMQIEASNYKNVELVVYNALGNNSRQISQIRKLISQNVDALIISPNEAIPITDVAVEAYEKGIPTIIHDRKIKSDKYTVSIGANNYNIGLAIGEYINNILSPGSKILEIWGLEGSSPAIERHEGFIAALNKNNDYKINEVYGKWQYNLALEETKKISSYNDIDLIFAHNDIMAIAARDEIMRRDSLVARRIKFIGIDGVYGDNSGIEAVANGNFEASFQYPTGGALAIQVAIDILNGKLVKKNYILNTTIIDKTNAKTILAQSEQLNNYQVRINRQKEEELNLLSRFRFLRNSTFLILGLLAVIVPLLSYVMYMNLKIKNKNRELHDKNLLVETQKQELSVKNEQIENISNQKLQFFTNISHEIRTPITLIVGPINKIIRSNKIDVSLREDIILMKRNVDRLYRIVNQILDFRRIDNNKMKLILTQTDIVSLAVEVFDYFKGIAGEKQIRYEFRTDIRERLIYIDINKIEQVLVNIISNAFKYSSSKGFVLVSIEENSDSIKISVKDKGIGLTEEEQRHIFERFYTSNKNLGSSGFGIGLNLAKEYIDLHDGTIDVESRQGEYTVFSITLYKDINHYSHEYIIEDISSFIPKDRNEMINQGLIQEKLAQFYDYKILIVEDDPDVRSFLRKELSANFEVRVAENGNEAIGILNEGSDVTLIVSDVLMPEMNGFELSNKLKTNIAFSHIPIILLTALSENSQRMYGFLEGADEYIQKPFDIDFLKIRIINIIWERLRIKEAFMEKMQAGFIESSDLDSVVGMDNAFRSKLMNLIEISYENSDFSIEALSEHIGLSRVHLYRKIKTLFGVSPTDFLRNYRLNIAIQLLKQKQYTVSEIAYMTGFTSPAYFTKCFKTLYATTPTEYITSLSQENFRG